MSSYVLRWLALERFLPNCLRIATSMANENLITSKYRCFRFLLIYTLGIFPSNWLKPLPSGAQRHPGSLTIPAVLSRKSNLLLDWLLLSKECHFTSLLPLSEEHYFQIKNAIWIALWKDLSFLFLQDAFQMKEKCKNIFLTVISHFKYSSAQLYKCKWSSFDNLPLCDFRIYLT